MSKSNISFVQSDPAAAIPVWTAPSSNPIVSGVKTVSTSAAALSANTLKNGIVLTADSSNTGVIYVGGSGVTTATGYPLAAGASISYSVTNLNMIYIIGTNTTDVLHFTGN